MDQTPSRIDRRMPRSKSDQYSTSIRRILTKQSSSLLGAVSLHFQLNKIHLKSPLMAPISITLSTRDPDAKGDRGRSQPVISLIVICCTRVVGAVSVVRVSTEHSHGQDAALHNPHWRLASFPRLPSEMQNRKAIPPKVFRHLSGESNDGRAAFKLCALHQPFGYQLYPGTTTPNICL